MYVYGIRCAPNDLMNLPESAQADYYLDYGLLVFPSYTRPSCLRTHTATGLTHDFWNEARLLIQHPMKTHRASHLEQPWLTDGEGEVVTALQEFYPTLQADWYYVPRTANQGSDPSSEDD
jgi:hypothetical protein